MDYADSQSGLRSLNIPRHTGMERGGAINLVFDDSVSVKNIIIRYITKNKILLLYDGRILCRMII